MKNISNSTAFAILYLCVCVLTDTKPNTEKISGINLKDLYTISKFHSLTAIVCEGLERSELSLSDENREYMIIFRKEKEKAVRKNLLLDTERSNICAYMEQHGIWYMPLKGVVLKDMYPKIGLRQMADNDILFDKTHRQAVKNYFLNRNYEVKAYGIGNHDVYLKNPVYNYEMHVALYEDNNSLNWQYYKDVKDRLVKDADNGFGYHFTDEDFYLYFISHGFKHFDESGNGLRFLLDLYVYLLKKNSEMNFNYINNELKKLGISEFEQNCRELVSEIFRNINDFKYEALKPEQRDLLLYFITSGTYGTVERRVGNGIKKRGKWGYLIFRIFPGADTLAGYHPVFKHKWLIPVGWVYRAFHIIFIHNSNPTRELKTIIKTKRKPLIK